MAILYGVLLEEVERQERVVASYEEMLCSLPRGSLFIRKMGGSSFAYLKRREGEKVISIYLGNVNGEEVKKQIELSKEYKRISDNLKIAKKELKQLRKVLKAYD